MIVLIHDSDCGRHALTMLREMRKKSNTCLRHVGVGDGDFSKLKLALFDSFGETMGVGRKVCGGGRSLDKFMLITRNPFS